MNYQKDVDNEARDFFLDHEEMIVTALTDDVEWDRNDIDDLDERFFETVTDRAYTLHDAAYIVEECENEETDTGLWEGQQPEDAIKTKAAFSFANDVWFECKRLYGELEEETDEKESDGGYETDREETAQSVYDEWAESLKTKPETDNERIKGLVRRWLDLADRAGMWSGFPVGESYIDTRCGSGHGIPEVKDFVDFDHEVAKRVPDIAGKYRADVEVYLSSI